MEMALQMMLQHLVLLYVLLKIIMIHVAKQRHGDSPNNQVLTSTMVLKHMKILVGGYAWPLRYTFFGVGGYANPKLGYQNSRVGGYAKVLYLKCVLPTLVKK